MAQEFSVEAVLSAVDKSFSSTINAALQNVYKLNQANNNAANGMASSGNSMMNTLKGVAGGFGIIQIAGRAWDVVKNSMNGAISRFDTLNKYPVVMKALDYSMTDIAKSSKILQKGIDGLPTSLDGITASAQQLGPLTGSATKAAKSAVALNNAFLASGASSADASRGLQQYTQMLSTGKVDLMSWRTLMETMPTALRAVAKSFGFTGKSAEMDLYNALSKGKISVEQLNDAFIKLNGGANGFASLAKKNSAGIGTSFENLKNSVIKNLTNMLTYIDQGFKNAGFGSIASTLDSMKNGINSAFKAIGPAVTTATTLILNFAKILKSVFDNDIFRSAAVGIVTFFAAFNGIGKVVGILKTLKSSLTVLKVAASVASNMNLLKFALSNMAAESKLAAVGMKILNAAMSLGPWGLIAAAIVAVVTALVIFFTKTKTGQKLWQGFVSWLQGAWQGLQEIASTVWNAIADFISGAVEKVKAVWQPIGEFFSNLWNSIKEIASNTWNGFITSIQPIVEAFKNLWNSLTEFFSTLWQGIIAIATPIWQGLVIVIGAIVAIIKGIWTGLTAFFSTLWQGIVTVATPIWQILVTVVQNVWNIIVAMWQNFVTIMSAVWQSVVTVAQTVWQVLVTVVSTIWNIIVTVISTAINVVAGIIQAVTAAIQGDWSGAWNAIKGVAETIWNGIKSVVSSVMNAIKSVISSIMNGIKSVFSTGWNAAKTVTSNGINACKNAVANIAKTMVSVGKDFVSGFIRGITSMIGAAVNAVMDLGRKAVGAAKSFFKIGSPSRVMMQYGHWFTEGFAIGITDEVRAVKQAVNTMAKAATSPIDPIGLQNSLRSLNGSVNSNYNGSLTMQDTGLQLQNNALLQRIADKSGNVYLDGDKWVGYTADTYDNRLGQNVSMKGRWS